MLKTALIVLSNRPITRYKLVRAQQQFGKIHDTFTLALRLILFVNTDQAATVGIPGINLIRSQPLFLGAVDKPLHVSRGILVVIDAGRLDKALDGR